MSTHDFYLAQSFSQCLLLVFLVLENGKIVVRKGFANSGLRCWEFVTFLTQPWKNFSHVNLENYNRKWIIFFTVHLAIIFTLNMCENTKNPTFLNKDYWNQSFFNKVLRWALFMKQNLRFGMVGVRSSWGLLDNLESMNFLYFLWLFWVVHKLRGQDEGGG